MRFLILASMVLVVGLDRSAVSQTTAPQGGQHKYSMDLSFKGLRTKDKAENMVRDSMTSMIGGVFYQAYTALATKPNPDAYIIVTVSGGDTFLIPRKLRQIDDRTTIVNFACRDEWVNKDLLIEVWRDNAESDLFWKTVLSTLTVDTTANAGGTILLMDAIPVEVSAKVRVKIENDTFRNLTLVHDQLLATCKTRLPNEGYRRKEKLVSSISSIGITRAVSMGELDLQNHGRVQPRP